MFHPPRVLPSTCALLLACALAVSLPQARAQQAEGPDEAERLVYLTEQYYPYNYREGDAVHGLSVELLRLVWERMGMPAQPILVQPWARVYAAALERPGTAVFGMARTPEREGLFKWACPIDTVRFVLFSRAADKAHTLSSGDLGSLVVGTVRGDVAEAALRALGRPVRIEAVADMELNLRKLDAGRLDLVAYEERGMRRLLERLGRDPGAYAPVMVLRETDICYAFHRDTPDALVARFQRALDAVRNEPEYTRLIRRFLD
jgi:polar amino acid transport system substrate-binding protein